MFEREELDTSSDSEEEDQPMSDGTCILLLYLTDYVFTLSSGSIQYGHNGNSHPHCWGTT